SRRVEPTPRNRAVCETLRSALGVVSSCGRNQFHTQKWRVIPDNLCSLLDLLPLAPPFLLNSLHLLLHHVLGETLFEQKEAPLLAGGVFDAALATVQVEEHQVRTHRQHHRAGAPLSIVGALHPPKM